MANELCAICGEKIIGKCSRDHVVPIAVLKWAKAASKDFTDEDFEFLYKKLNSKANICKTHRACNHSKCDSSVFIDDLYLTDENRECLRQLLSDVEPYLVAYEILKSKLTASQNSRCAICKTKLRNSMILRRKDNRQKRTYSNAQILCVDCNARLRANGHNHIDERRFRKK